MAIELPTVKTTEIPTQAFKPESPGLVARYAYLAGLLALTLLALALRSYDLALMGWIPDNYEQLEATQRLLRGDLPLSTMYPPGVAVVMAPFFAVLPDSLGTMQLVVVAAGVTLTPAAYVLTLRTSGDRLSALLAALLVAVSMTFVHYSRDGHFDVIYMLFFVLALLGASKLERRGVAFLAGYGALLALLANFRVTNLAIVPALLLIWLQPLDVRLDPRVLLRERILTRVLIVPAVFLALMLASVLFSGWFGQPSSGPTFESFADHLLIYAYAVVFGLPGLVLLVPLALAGTARLWRLNRSLTLALGYIIFAWPPLFAGFVFTEARYMLPAHFCLLLLTAIGAAIVWSARPPAAPLARVVRLYLPGAVVFFLVILMTFTSVAVIGGWRESAAQSDEGMFREVRPAVRAIEEDALLVSAMTQGLGANLGSFERIDLIEHYLAHGSDEAGVQSVVSAVQQALADDRNVYYLYSRYEAGDDFEGKGRQGFRNFFDGIAARYQVHQVFVTESRSFGTNPWLLYEVSEAPPAGR